MKDRKTILVDMDEVIFFTHNRFTERFRENIKEISPLSYKQSKSFILEELYPEEYRIRIDSLWRQKGFFKDIPLISGALEALTELKSKHDVWICSSPIRSPYCMQEKYESIRDQLGEYWLKRLIMTKDKTLVRGDILIDDKPKITGEMIPTWEHVLYSHPWNEHITDKRRITWDNYKRVLLELFNP